MRLATEEILADKTTDFDATVHLLSPHYNRTLLDDRIAGRALKFYLMLTELQPLIADLGLSAEEIFWSRYYWFRRYSKLRQAMVGSDAGLNQQSFNILEHPEPPCTPNWSELESIEAQIEQDVAAQLSSLSKSLWHPF